MADSKKVIKLYIVLNTYSQKNGKLAGKIIIKDLVKKIGPYKKVGSRNKWGPIKKQNSS